MVPHVLEIAVIIVSFCSSLTLKVRSGELDANISPEKSLLLTGTGVKSEVQCEKLPGAGLKQYKGAMRNKLHGRIMQDGYRRNGCYKDGMFYSGDKFGKNKHSYKLSQRGNVSILHYDAVVGKESQEAMSPAVCFNLCRRVPEMIGFGLIHGRHCYCAPYFDRVAGDSSDCDDVCEGDQVQMCGGATKSSIFTMHTCDQGEEKLKAAVESAESDKKQLLLQAGRLEYLAKNMQKRAAVLQQNLGSVGDPHSSDLMQDAKVFAGEVLADAKRGSQLASAISAKLRDARGLPKGAERTAAEKTTKDLEGFASQAKAEFEALMKVQDLISPRVTASKLRTYWKIMHYVDKKHLHEPTTCSGTSEGKPIVGKSYGECARACDDLMGACVGFTFFPSRLCFLFREIKSVTYFSGCNDGVPPENPSPIETSFLRVSCSVKQSDFASRDVALKKSTACPVYSDEGMEFKSVWPGLPTHITSSAFREGTLIIDSPGLYHLEESISFDPQTPLTSGISGNDVSFPDPTSEKYPQLGGYYLGFFAAIAVTADNVTIDCKGNTIAMSPNFHKRQRFFAAIELASKPFIAGAGPPQFSNDFLTRAPIVVPNNVRIANCKFGLSSHHGIHGNNNKGVTLKNLEFQDFEVGGISLNGASNVVIEDVRVGGSLKKTFFAQLSQANFIDHMMNTLLPMVPEIDAERNQAKIVLRGEEHTVGDVFRNLHSDLNTYYDSNGGPLAQVFGDGLQPPDGSAVYGIVIHKTGPAVNDFGACPQSTAEASGQTVSNITIKNVNIEDLQVDAFQMTRLMLDGKQVMGPAGDVFDWKNNVGTSGDYVGNKFSDAQLAVGAFKKHLEETWGIDPQELSYFFGGTNIPDSVLDWASAKGTTWKGGSFKCDGDAMSHANKGAVGLFLNHIASGADLEGIAISKISNTGQIDALSATCVENNYKGTDTRGVAVVNSPAVTSQMLNDDVTVESLKAGAAGKVFDFYTLRT